MDYEDPRQEEQLYVVKEVCTKNSLPCLWKAMVLNMTDRLYMTLAVDPVNFSLNIFYSDSQITYLHTFVKGT